MPILYIVIGIAVVLFLLWPVFIYNRFISLRVRIKEAWSDIETQLKRRYDLIPNLVNTVKGYAKHERETFEKVTEMRANALSAHGVAEQGKAENMLTDALKSLFAVAENYPDLKANENFLELQREVTDTENKIQAARRFYNSTVKDMNIKVQQIPDSVIAGMFSFKKEEFFELDEAEREAAEKPVNVKF